MQLAKIKLYANQKGIMLKYLTEKAGVSYQNLNKSIKENKISAQHLENIANILSVDINEFFDTDTLYTIKPQTKDIANEPFDKYNLAESKLRKEIELLKKDIELYKIKLRCLRSELKTKRRSLNFWKNNSLFRHLLNYDFLKNYLKSSKIHFITHCLPTKLQLSNFTLKII